MLVEIIFAGGHLATVADIQQAIRFGYTDGCTCGFVKDDFVLRGVELFFDLSCQGIPGLPSFTQGLFSCTSSITNSVWCIR